MRRFIDESREAGGPTLDLVREVYRAFLSGEIEFDREVVDPEMSWEPPADAPTAGSYSASEVRDEIALWTEPFDEFDWVPIDLIPAGERWVVVGDMSGIGRTSGVAIQQREYHVWTARDGRIIRMQMFLDRDEALRAAGLSSS